MVPQEDGGEKHVRVGKREGEEGVGGEVGEESGFEVEAVGGGYWRMLVRMKKMCGEG